MDKMVGYKWVREYDGEYHSYSQLAHDFTYELGKIYHGEIYFCSTFEYAKEYLIQHMDEDIGHTYEGKLTLLKIIAKDTTCLICNDEWDEHIADRIKIVGPVASINYRRS